MHTQNIQTCTCTPTYLPTLAHAHKHASRCTHHKRTSHHIGIYITMHGHHSQPHWVLCSLKGSSTSMLESNGRTTSRRRGMRNSKQDKVLRAMVSCSDMVQILHSKKKIGIHVQQNYRLHVWCNSAYACNYVVSCRQTTTSLLHAQFMKTSLYKDGGRCAWLCEVSVYKRVRAIICITSLRCNVLYAHMYLSAWNWPV